MRGRARFEIDRLPDAFGRAVALFAFELEGVRRVIDAQHEPLVLAPLHDAASARTRTACSRRDARPPPGRRASPWSASRDAPTTRNTRLPCHASGTLIGPRYQPMSASFSTPDKLEPHGNGTVIGQRKSAPPPRPNRLLAGVLLVEAKLPGAVQVQPVGTLEVGPRMLGQRDGRRIRRNARCSQEQSRPHRGHDRSAK